ncbi:MAG: VOC family protein [Proteobacteria bacterium]|nr:VOC family protein [Pseudomonadota bacterium]
MAELSTHTPGSFCWVDLATTDAAAAKAFYSELFGWTAQDMPAGDAGTYTMFFKQGKSVCGAYGMNEQMRSQGVPPHWASYVAVDSADQAAARAKELGAEILQPAFDVMTIGRMAVIKDPQGAVLSLWQPKEDDRTMLVNEPGCWSWNELQTTDTAAAKNFYQSLLGWTSEVQKGATGQDYTSFKNGERPAAGMLEIQKEWGPVPPHWAVYFSVGDLDASLERLKNLGGSQDGPTIEMKDFARFAIVHDPQGGHFVLIQMLVPTD